MGKGTAKNDFTMKKDFEKLTLEKVVDGIDRKTIYKATNGVLLDFMQQLDKLEKRNKK